jgi:hypothetical protein
MERRGSLLARRRWFAPSITIGVRLNATTRQKPFLTEPIPVVDAPAGRAVVLLYPPPVDESVCPEVVPPPCVAVADHRADVAQSEGAEYVAVHSHKIKRSNKALERTPRKFSFGFNPLPGVSQLDVPGHAPLLAAPGAFALVTGNESGVAVRPYSLPIAEAGLAPLASILSALR